jgi:hypothetical protein
MIDDSRGALTLFDQRVRTRRKMTSAACKRPQRVSGAPCVAKMYGISERSLWRNLRWAAELEEVRAG